jgi:Family of unknown function (DUF5946)
MSRCPECGATVDDLGSCDDLFNTLLALDHSRQPPWGPLHAIASACFHLQHPSRLAESGRAVQWAYIQHFLRNGSDALTGMTEHVRKLNSHRQGGRRPRATDFDGVPTFPGGDPPQVYATTIADVSVDGGFPAAGHVDRLTAWAHATTTAWGERDR